MATSVFDGETLSGMVAIARFLKLIVVETGPIWSIKLPENQQLQMTSMTFQNGLCNCKGGALNIDSKAGSLVYIFSSYFLKCVSSLRFVAR